MQESYVVHALWHRHETPGVRRHPQTALLLFARPVMDGPTVVALDVVDYPECGALHPAEVGELAPPLVDITTWLIRTQCKADIGRGLTTAARVRRDAVIDGASRGTHLGHEELDVLLLRQEPDGRGFDETHEICRAASGGNT